MNEETRTQANAGKRQGDAAQGAEGQHLQAIRRARLDVDADHGGLGFIGDSAG